MSNADPTPKHGLNSSVCEGLVDVHQISGNFSNIQLQIQCMLLQIMNLKNELRSISVDAQLLTEAI